MRGMVLCVLLIFTHEPWWEIDYANVEVEKLDWFRVARLTPEAMLEFGRMYCCDECDAADHTPTEIRVDGEKWQYLDAHTWRDIPNYVIHTKPDPKMPAQLKLEGVLFIFDGRAICFWPPQNGG